MRTMQICAALVACCALLLASWTYFENGRVERSTAKLKACLADADRPIPGFGDNGQGSRYGGGSGVAIERCSEQFGP